MCIRDSATPISQPGELPRLLASLQKVRGAGQIIVLVVSEPSIENQAAEKVQSVVSRFPSLNTVVIGAPELALIQQRMEQLGLGKLQKEIGLSGYGAVRNLGLVMADVQMCIRDRACTRVSRISEKATCKPASSCRARQARYLKEWVP